MTEKLNSIKYGDAYIPDIKKFQKWLNNQNHAIGINNNRYNPQWLRNA